MRDHEDRRGAALLVPTPRGPVAAAVPRYRGVYGSEWSFSGGLVYECEMNAASAETGAGAVVQVGGSTNTCAAV